MANAHLTDLLGKEEHLGQADVVLREIIPEAPQRNVLHDQLHHLLPWKWKLELKLVCPIFLPPLPRLRDPKHLGEKKPEREAEPEAEGEAQAEEELEPGREVEPEKNGKGRRRSQKERKRQRIIES